jgi:hypothetical protein
VHYVGRYIISFQNARSLQHKIWYCTKCVTFTGFVRMCIMEYSLNDVHSNVLHYYSGMYSAVVIQLIRNIRKESSTIEDLRQYSPEYASDFWMFLQ